MISDDLRIEGYEESYRYALDLAERLNRKHYPDNNDWMPEGDLLGLLIQIDNMVAGFISGVVLYFDEDRHIDGGVK